jgi:transcriptional regulator with PAS, ATPase and Fis domain
MPKNDCPATLAVEQLPEHIRRLSLAQWGREHETVMVGRDPRLLQALQRTVRFAGSESPVLFTGETGTGKELFARSLFLTSNRTNRPFLCLNCAQYTSEQLVVSELFGHKKGSFTGALTDHSGVFQEADGGCVFLDEIGELPLSAQGILLRLLSEGEIVPVGGTRARAVDVRVIAATTRDLQEMVDAGRFRADLYFRLNFLHVHIPPLRERGDDWQLIACFFLDLLGRKHAISKRLSHESVERLRAYSWPGNVREVRSFMETGFHLSAGELITPTDLAEALESGSRAEQLRKIPFVHTDLCARMISREETFWQCVYEPFMARDLNRVEVRAVIAEGLRLAGGSYKRMLDVFGVAPEDYLKLMDFLRHHQLKPDDARGAPAAAWSHGRSERAQEACTPEALTARRPE